jgi:hypothetical protein
MDPNVNLDEQIKLALSIQKANDYSDEGDGLLDAEDASRLAELVLDLHGWLVQGGFLPARWLKSEELKCPKCETVYLSEPGYTGIRLCRKCEAPVDANPNRQGLGK